MFMCQNAQSAGSAQPQRRDARCSAALCCGELGGSRRRSPGRTPCHLEGTSLQCFKLNSTFPNVCIKSGHQSVASYAKSDKKMLFYSWEKT